LLFSAECFTESAIFFGIFDLRMCYPRSIALLVCVTFLDHFFGAAFFVAVFEDDFFVPDFFGAGFLLEVNAFAIKTFRVHIQA